MRMMALNVQCAAMLAAREPVVTRRPAMITPPANRTRSAPTKAGMTKTTGIVVFTTVNHVTPVPQGERDRGCGHRSADAVLLERSTEQRAAKGDLLRNH